MCGIFGNDAREGCSGPRVRGLHRLDRGGCDSSGDGQPGSGGSVHRDAPSVSFAAADARPRVIVFLLQPCAASLAKLKGTDVDRSRELAKSVPVEYA
jgi:glucosamine 6-phosphate synthetase-like amidotransferase/phosphosugar isomerase protein